MKLTFENILAYPVLFRDFINNLPAAVIITDNKGICQYISEYCIKESGFNQSDFIGNKIPWIHCDDIEFVYDNLLNSTNGAIGAINLEYRAQKKDGKFWVASTSWNPIRVNKKIQGFILLTNDITWQKLHQNVSEDNNENLQSVFQSTLDRIAVWDHEFKYLYANEAEQRYHGLSKNEIIGKNVNSIYIKNRKNLSNWKKIVGLVFETGEPQKFEDIVSTKNKKSVGEVLVSPIKDNMGSINAVVFVYRDITDRKLQEYKLQKLNEQLKISNSELEQFAYIASHDLQEPLRAIAGYVQLIEKRMADCIDEDSRGYIKRAVAASERLRGLIHDILSFSRITTHAKEFSRIDLNDTLLKIILNLSVLIEEKKALVEYKELPVIYADSSQILLLFQNLISNAIKFNFSKQPHIRITFKKDIKNKHWLFSISDNGIGIEKKYFEKIFIMFQRLHTRDEFPGSGIGLTLCKKIVERHNGRIWIESEKNIGSTFNILLPFNIRRL